MQRITALSLSIVLILISGCSQEIDSKLLKQKYASGASKFIEVDGMPVHYREESSSRNRAKETILLLHGTASSLHTWDDWAARLKNDYRVVRMDLPGFGLTGPDPQARYEVSDDVAFLERFMNKLNIQKAHLVGSSLGGRIAWEFSLNDPSRIQSLTLINSLGYPQESWPPAIDMAQKPVFDWIIARFLPEFMFRPSIEEMYHKPSRVTDDLVKRYFELSRYPGNMAEFPKRVKARLDQDSPRISQISVPTLILWGESDLYFPVESAYRFRKDIPNAELTVFPNAGHLPMEEIPEQSIRRYLQFLDSQA